MNIAQKKVFIGKTVIGTTGAPDGTLFTLLIEDGEDISFHVDADCCSESWIEHITEPKYPAIILDYEEKDLGEAPATRQEYDQKYSAIFKTDRGDLELEFRNSSNGYYGGTLVIIGYDYEGKKH